MQADVWTGKCLRWQFGGGFAPTARLGGLFLLVREGKDARTSASLGINSRGLPMLEIFGTWAI